MLARDRWATSVRTGLIQGQGRGVTTMVTETNRLAALTTVGRRRFLALTGGFAASAILAACGGSAATDTPRPSSPTTGAAPTTAAASAATSPIRAAGSVTTGTTAAGTTTTGTTTTGTTAVGSATTGTTTAGSGQVLAIDASEYAFKTLGSVPGGVTTVQLRNIGKEPHEAQFIKLNPGVTLDQVIAALQQNGPPPD